MSKSNWILFLGILVSLCTDSLIGQESIRFEKMPASSGFFQGITYAIDQDEFGNLWLATEEGIVRYNAHEAITYGPGNGLPNNYGSSIKAVHVAPGGRVWIAGEDGLAFYDPITDSFIGLDRPGAVNPNLIREVIELDENTLIVGAFNGLWQVDAETGSSTKVINTRNVEALLPFDNDKILVGAGSGVYLLEVGNSEFREVQYPEGFEAPIFSMGADAAAVLVGTQNGELFRLGKDQRQLEYVATISDSPIRSIQAKPGQGWYVATDGDGLFELDNSLVVVRQYRNDVNRSQSIASDGIYDLLIDREGILWIATYGGGLNKLDPHNNLFSHITHLASSDQSISHPFTRSILQDRTGRVWFGTKNGISVWQPMGNSWQHLLRASGDAPRPIVTALVEDESYVYASTYLGRLYSINKRTLFVSEMAFLASEETKPARIFTLAFDAQQNLWVGGVNMSVYRISPHGEITQIPVSQSKVLSFDESAGIWSAGRDALRLIKADNGGGNQDVSVQVVEPVEQYRQQHAFNIINAIAPVSSELVYLATSGAGLLTFNPQSGAVAAIGTAQGLPSENVLSINFDERGSLWAGTSRGLARVSFDAKDTIVQIYTEADGILGTDFNAASTERLTDGRLIFGSSTGSIIFDPIPLQRDIPPPAVVFEDLYLFNERQTPGTSVLPAHLNTLKRLELQHDQQALTVRFAGVSHAAAGNILYRWKMEGLEGRWSKSSTLDRINFTNLDPGDYKFSVQAASQSGNWGDARELSILIHPPWWKTNLAKVAYLLLLIAIGFIAFRLSRSLIRKRNVERQIDFFNNITHELKTPLAILLSSLEEITETEKEQETTGKIQATIKRLSALFEQLLNFHKASSSGKSRHVFAFSPGERLNELLARFTPLLKEKGLSVVIEDDLAPDVFHYDKTIFDKIVFNLVSNAVKYSKPNGTIQARLSVASENSLELQIEDDGIGIPADQQKYILREYYRARNAINSQLPGTGLGLMMVKSMVEKEGGAIRFTSEENRGTTFFVSMVDRKEDLSSSPEQQMISVASKAGSENHVEAVGDRAHILLVEDNDELRLTLSGRLGKYFKVSTATNGKEGLKLAAKVFPDLIITDLIMPEMDGMEMSREIQKDIQLNHIPIYLLTVLHNSQQKVESIAAGVSEYLEKPVNFDLLLAKINNTLNWRQRMRERYAAQDEAEQAALHRTDRENEFIDQLESFTRENISNDGLSVQDLCRHIGMSRTSLYMKMKNLIGLSPQDFIIHTRLKEARRMLTESGETIKSIAYDCGFSNPKYFSTSFKKKYGESPGAFRKGLSPQDNG